MARWSSAGTVLFAAVFGSTHGRAAVWASPADANRGRAECDRNAREKPALTYGGVAAQPAAGGPSGERTAAAVPPHTGQLPDQGAKRHDHHRYREHLSLSGAWQWQGAALRHRR